MKKMRVVSLLISLLVCLTLVAPSAAALQTSSFELPKGTSVSARAAMVVYLGASAEQDTVVYAKGTDQKLAPGGMVRIMAGITAKALMTEKHLDLDTGTGTYTSACFAQITGTGIPTAGMETGDVWTLRDLLTMALLQPAGDVVETLAFSLAGSEQAFVQRMNELASGEVGCTDTTFKNVTGLDASGQVSTAMDTYRILRYAMGDSDLEAMMALSYYTAKPKKGSEITLPSSNNLLRVSTDSYYGSAVLGRAGSSDTDGSSVAAVARSNGYEYMAVVMGASNKSGNAHFTDAKTLFQWAFRNFSLGTIRSKNDPIADLKVRLCWDQDRVQLVPKEDVMAILPDALDLSTVVVKATDIPEVINAPVSKGQVCGKAAFYTPDGQKLAECDLVADQTLSRNQWLFVWYCVGRFFSSRWFWGGFVILMLLCGGYVLLTIQHNKQRRAEHQQKVRPPK